MHHVSRPRGNIFQKKLYYLDLYNYAGRFGDTVRPQEIAGNLKQKDAYISETVRSRKLEELWTTFDSINRKMLITALLDPGLRFR
ncbi:hypothetical protein [Paenibacillus ehimensis]|uniref:Uncharacterized protein n=1 Tax=Paenibacillus ehimensis TaxID=79264 RepID=A0ABT8V9I4_9BACL|nr:hypothetical protein [Paenibacillus ehimensis]MDO3677447.1 hypothetical protein [Paenibacillus ehimensis]